MRLHFTMITCAIHRHTRSLTAILTYTHSHTHTCTQPYNHIHTAVHTYNICFTTYWPSIDAKDVAMVSLQRSIDYIALRNILIFYVCSIKNFDLRYRWVCMNRVAQTGSTGCSLIFIVCSLIFIVPINIHDSDSLKLLLIKIHNIPFFIKFHDIFH